MAGYSLADKRVWITGASYGIGRHLALELTDRGVRLALSARSSEKLESVAEECGSPDPLVLPLDVTDRDANHRAVQQIDREFGGLDVAVFNAGTSEFVDTENFDAELFEKLYRVNVFGVVYGVEAVLPLFQRDGGGYLVGMSSSSAYLPLPRAEAYGSTKSAVKYLFESLRIDLSDRNVDVTVICPGFVDTPLTDKNDFPMPFLMQPEDAARRIANGMERKHHEIHFPSLFTYVLKCIGRIPSRLYTLLIRKTVGSQ